MKEIKHWSNVIIYTVICITLILIILRILFYFINIELLSENSLIFIMMKNRDLNFKSLYNLMDNGIIFYYQEHPFTQDKAIYLYFWFFIFYPFYLMPMEVSMYIWDLLRLISTIFIIVKIRRITENERDILYFYFFLSIGYFADMYLNNTNWLIQIFLFESYSQLKKEDKRLSYILFALASFKITIIAFPIILLIIKKIKIKEMINFYIPIALISIPYIVFPNYLLQIISNWSESGYSSSSFILFDVFFKIWPLIQMPHLMFISIIALIVLVNIKNEKLKKRLELLIYSGMLLIWVITWSLILLLLPFL